MRTEFLKAMEVVPLEQLPWETFTQVIPSTQRIESYPWMSPSSGFSRYLGHRRYSQFDQIKYNVENLEFDDSIVVKNRDVEDDQYGGYLLRCKEMGEKAKIFPGINVLQTLATAVSSGLPCFDGTNFFATAHNVGTYPTVSGTGWGGGGNALTYTATGSSDTLTHRLVFLIHNGSGGALKPLLWQNRKGPNFDTSAGTPESRESKESHYWADLEGASAFGYWWQAVAVTITNTPSITDLQIVFDKVMTTFFQFVLPAALPTDPPLYMHQGLQFNAKNTTVVCSTGLWALLRHLLNEDRIGINVGVSTGGVTSNIYYQMFGLISTAYLNV